MGNTSLRYNLYKEQNGKCHYCRVQMNMANLNTAYVHMKPFRHTICTVDHVVSRATGGKNTRANYVGACLRCNNLKGTLPYGPFRWFVMRYGNLRQPEEVARSLTREEYDQSVIMWKALLRSPVVPSGDIVLPNWKTRRSILHDVRTSLKNTVSSVDIFEQNAMWGKYLKQEKHGGNFASSVIE